MERNEILKSIGFSDRFLQALTEHQQKVPTVYLAPPFSSNHLILENTHSSNRLIITDANDTTTKGVVVYQQ